MMTGRSHAHGSQHWIIWAAGGLALLLVGGFAFLLALGMYVRSHPTVTAPVTVTMGKVVLRIPRNYFMALPSHDIQGRPDGVDFILLGLMPNFEPRTATNRAEFADFHGLGRKLDVLVQYKGHMRTGKESFSTFYKMRTYRTDTRAPYTAGASIVDSNFGYHSFNTGGLEHMFHGTTDNPTDFIHCRPKEQIVPPDGKPLPYFPYCERFILIGDDIVVQFSFSRDFLGSAHDIEAQVIDILNRFRISGPALKVIQ